MYIVEFLVEGATFTSLDNNEYSSVLSVGPLDDTMSMGRYKCVVNSNAEGVKSETKEFILPGNQWISNCFPVTPRNSNAKGCLWFLQ